MLATRQNSFFLFFFTKLNTYHLILFTKHNTLTTLPILALCRTHVIFGLAHFTENGHQFASPRWQILKNLANLLKLLFDLFSSCRPQILVVKETCFRQTGWKSNYSVLFLSFNTNLALSKWWRKRLKNFKGQRTVFTRKLAPLWLQLQYRAKVMQTEFGEFRYLF